MGLFDFDIHDDMPEKANWHEISTDGGKTWGKKLMTPSEVMQALMFGFATRPAYNYRRIAYFPRNSDVHVYMEIPVPASVKDRDGVEAYIDEYLDGMLNDFLRWNNDWYFAE